MILFAKPNASRTRAFTLTELMVALTVTLILVLLVSGTFMSILRTSDSMKANTSAVTNGRVVLDRMSLDLRNPVLIYGEEDALFVTRSQFFQTYAGTGLDYDQEIVGYYIADVFDGDANVLVRHTTRTLTGSEVSTVTLAPIAYNVLSFDLQYWDPNSLPSTPLTYDHYWRDEWDPANYITKTFKLPASIRIEVDVYAGRKPFEAVDLSTETPTTITMTTIVNNENVLGDPAFRGQGGLVPNPFIF